MRWVTLARFYRVPTANLALRPSIRRMRLALTLAIAMIASLAVSGAAQAAPRTVTVVEAVGAKGWYGGSASTGSGGDTVTVTGTQQWIVNGADGDDEITGSDQADDVLSGGPGNDLIDGLGNSGLPYDADPIDGGADNDLLRGGAGDDSVDGGPGNDDVHGGDGDDYLGGEEGVDALHGDAGDDWLEAGAGDGELSDGGDCSDEILCVGDPGETYDGGAGLDLIECVGLIVDGPDAGYDDYVIDLSAGTVKQDESCADDRRGPVRRGRGDQGRK